MADSLQLMEYIKGSRVLDIGSGGGFPGMVMAICGDFCVTCLDSDKRKVSFLEEVARLTETKVNFSISRIENFDDTEFDTVCARGFSKLADLLQLTAKHSRHSYGVFLKGQKIHSEIEEAKRDFSFNYSLFQSKTDDSGKIIKINNICKLAK